MPAPLSAQEAIRLAEEELKTPDIVTFFGFFNFDGESLGDEVAEAFVANNLLTDDGKPLAAFTQLFQLPQNKKSFENRIRKLIFINFIKKLVAERLGQGNLPVFENYHLIIRGVCEAITGDISQIIDKEPLPENDFLPQPYASELAENVQRIINNFGQDKTKFYSLFKFLLSEQYQNQAVIPLIADRLIKELENSLKKITIPDITNQISFYDSIVLVEGKLVIDLNFYNLLSDNPQVENIERYQLEPITLEDRFQQYSQETKNLETVLQTTIDTEEGS